MISSSDISSTILTNVFGHRYSSLLLRDLARLLRVKWVFYNGYYYDKDWRGIYILLLLFKGLYLSNLLCHVSEKKPENIIISNEQMIFEKPSRKLVSFVIKQISKYSKLHLTKTISMCQCKLLSIKFLLTNIHFSKVFRFPYVIRLDANSPG